MKILFEGMRYDYKKLSSVLPDGFYYEKYGEAITDYVGYFYSCKEDDGEPVFILPKVFIDRYGNILGLGDGNVQYRDVFDFGGTEYPKYLVRRYDHLLFKLSIWIFQAIQIYEKRGTVAHLELPNVYNSKRHKKQSSLMELYIGIINFYRSNRHIFTFISKTSHAGKKIKWHKTISSEQPVIVDNTPIYISPLKVLKRINYEEELIVLLYSVLNHFKRQFNLKIQFEFNYKIYTGREFQRLLNGQGVRILKRIKHKYYRDVFLRLWDLLYAFFEFNKEIRLKGSYQESLLCSNFPIVFEDMVDNLISDEDYDDIKYYKDQKDGKIVDHLYQYNDLFDDGKIFYVADSKYYRDGSIIAGIPFEKQFTYAKNIIQDGIDVLLGNGSGASLKKIMNSMRYRDEATEGYNITPNFFIRGVIMDKNPGKHIQLSNIQKWSKRVHFENRLFDRDTLILLSFELDFMFALTMYLSKSKERIEKFKNDVHSEFRGRFIKTLEQHYDFYIISFDNDTKLNDVVREYFKKLNGKIYSPEHKWNGKSCLILALENGHIENDDITRIFYEDLKDQCSVERSFNGPPQF